MKKVIAIAVICGLFTTPRGNPVHLLAKPMVTGLNHPAVQTRTGLDGVL
jgi:hypothetical protein